MTGAPDRPDVPDIPEFEPEALLDPGDVVRLKSGYSPEEGDSTVYTHGIVAEIVSEANIDNGRYAAIARELDEDRLHIPRNVSLFLFEPDSEQMYLHKPGPGDHGIPVFVDFHVGDLMLVQKATGDGYRFLDIDPWWCITGEKFD